MEDPGQVVAGAEEVAEEGEVGHQMNNKEKLGVWYHTLIWEAMDITVKEGVEEPNDVIVSHEEDAEGNNNKYFRNSSVYI